MTKIYMIVSNDEYELPEIVSESIVEMARRLGRNYQSLRSDFCKGSKPDRYPWKYYRKFVTVEVDE